MPVKKKNNHRGYYIKCMIGIAFLFGFGYLPAAAPITPVGMKILGIFIGAIYLWSVAGVVWPALLAIVAYGMSGYVDMSTAISSGMGNTVVFQLILIIAMAGVVSGSGAGEFLARWAVSRPVFKGKPELFMFVFFETFLLSAFFVNVVATIYLSWAIFYGISEIAGYGKGEKFSTLTIIGCTFISMLGGAAIPFKGWQLGLANAYNKATESELNFALFMGLCLVLCTVMIILYIISMKYLFGCDFSKLKDFDPSVLGNKGKSLDIRQKCYLYAYAFIIIITVVSTLLPRDNGFYKLINGQLTVAGLFAVVVAVLCMIRLGDGNPILDWKKDASKWVNWDVVFMCAIAIPVAGALTSEETGVLELANQMFGTLFAGRTAIFLLVFIIIITTVLTNIGSNIGMGMALVPIIAPFITSTGTNAQLAGIALIFASNMGMMLPGASAPAAVLFSNREWVQPKDIYRYAGFCNLLFMIVSIIGFAVMAAVM